MRPERKKEEGKEKELIVQFEQKKAEEETPGGAGDKPCKGRSNESRGERTIEGESLETLQFEFIARYRRGASESEEDVPRNGDGLEHEAEEEGTKEGAVLPEEEEKQFIGVGNLGGIEGRLLEREPLVRRRTEDSRSRREIPRPFSLRGAEGDLEDGGERHG